MEDVDPIFRYGSSSSLISHGSVPDIAVLPISSRNSAIKLQNDLPGNTYQTFNGHQRGSLSTASRESLNLIATGTSHSHDNHGHDHDHQDHAHDHSSVSSSGDHCHVGTSSTPLDSSRSARRRLIFASVLCLIFMIGEALGGYFAGSLAVLTDAAHLLTDFASFMISLFSLWLGARPATKKMSFGWYRAEVIGALTSVVMIWVITGILVYEAVQRIRTGEYEINASVMLITAGVGVAFNIIMGISLHDAGGHHHHGHSHGHSHGGPAIVEVDHGNPGHDPIHGHGGGAHGHGHGTNINVRAAFIHVVGDLCQSVGVLIAAYIIYYKPEWRIVDPICTFLFSVLVLFTTVTIMRETLNVLMEGLPRGMDFNRVRDSLQEVPGVIRIHNLRIWALTMEKIALSAHLAIDSSVQPQEVLRVALVKLRKEFNIHESTLQIEEYHQVMVDCHGCQEPKD